MNKRGQGAEKISAIIIILATMFVLAFGIWQLAFTGQAEANKRICQASILASSVSIDKTGLAIKLKCDRNELIIKGRTVFDGDELDDDKFNRRIAKVMYDCKGIIRDFNPYGKEKGAYCLVCSEITFDDKFKEKAEGVKLKVPYLWMAKNTIPNSDLTYHEFLAGYKPTQDDFDFLRKMESEDVIYPGEDYVVIVRTDLEGINMWKALGALGAGGLIGGAKGAAAFSWTGPGAIIGGIGGAIIGGASGMFGYATFLAEVGYSNSVYFVPENQLSGYLIKDDETLIDFCTYLVN